MKAELSDAATSPGLLAASRTERSKEQMTSKSPYWGALLNTASSPQSYEKIHVCCFKPTVLCSFVTAALENSHRGHLWITAASSSTTQSSTNKRDPHII